MSDQRATPARQLRPNAGAPSRPTRRAFDSRAHSEREWRVSDDLPRPTPVGRAEIEAFEVYLGGQVDEILRRMRA